jgi:alkylation response protein AidB-like acyl-CoA dehydrogenase
MDFNLGDRSDAFRAEVHDFVAGNLRPEAIERVHETGTVHDWDFYRALGAQGWIAASWPSEYGGQDRDPFEMTALRDELRMAQVPLDGMGNSLIVARTIRHLGTDEQKQTFLPPLLSGEIIFALGYSEPDSGSDVAAAKTTAVRDGEEWVIKGQKMFTTLAHEARYVFLLARTDPDVPKHKGLTMFIVPLDSPGIEIHPVHTMGGERTNITYYDDVRVPDRFRVGEVDGGWNVLTVALTFERGGFGLSEADRVWQQVVDWATSTEREGRSAIEDTDLRERLAWMRIHNEVATLLAYRTSWVATQGGMPGVEGSMHKLWYAESMATDSAELIDMLAPEGLLAHGAEGAPVDGWVETLYRHAPVTSIYGGTSEVQRSIIAERGLGLPRTRGSGKGGGTTA